MKTYWNSNGKFQEILEELEMLMPSSGMSDDLGVELYRAGSSIYYDLHNNGFGNDWSSSVRFIEIFSKVPIPHSIREYMYGEKHIKEFNGSKGTKIQKDMEILMDNLLPECDKLLGKRNLTDCILF